MKTIIHMVNGIMTIPGESKNWNVEGVDWVQCRSDCYAVAVQYWCSPIGRVFGQKRRAQKLRDSLMCYQGDWERVLVGHSNGADVIVDCLRDYPELPPIDVVHLVCGATESDFQKNRLNAALAYRRVGRVATYCAGKDRALALAHTLPGRLLGYGTLGLEGPQNIVPSLRSRVSIKRWPTWGHSQCWSEENYDETMALFLP